MADNSRAKTHLDQVERKLENIGNVSDINSIISARSLDLFSNLSSENLFVDDDIKANLQAVNNKLIIGGLDLDASNEIMALDLEFAGATPARGTEIGREINALLKITNGTRAAPLTGSDKLIARRFEYNQLNRYSNYFNLGSTITDIDLDTTTAPGAVRGGLPNISQDLDHIFKAVAAPNVDYKLCDDQGVPLPESGGNYTIQIGGQTVTLSRINLAAGRLDLTNLTITPPNVDLSESLNLSINATYTNAAMVAGVVSPPRASLRNINLVCNKKFKLNLTDGAPLPDKAAREVAFDVYNGLGQRIENQFETTVAKERYKIERESLERALRHCDGPKYELLNTPELKEQFYQQIRKSVHPGLPGLFFDALYATLPINTYAGFRDWFTDDDKDWNKDKKNTSSDRKYRDFIHNNLESKTKESIGSGLDKLLIDSPSGNNYVKGELTSFLDEIQKQKLDNDMHEDIASDIKDGEKGIQRHRLNKKRRRSILGLFRVGVKDETPIRFFNGSKISIQNQSVNISTNDKPEELNNKEPVKYGLDLEVSGKNKIEAKITLEGEEPFTLKSGDPAALIRNVLKNQSIKYGKVRAHIAYNIIKGIINMSKEIDMPLFYSRPPGINSEIKLDGDNIVLEDQDDTGSKRKTTKLFDSKLFETTNTFDSTTPHDNRSLRNGIDLLMGHMTLALNEKHEQFCKSTELKWNTTTDFPTSYITSPLKKLLNARTTTNFDFETTVQGKNGKNIQVSFIKNNFTINYEGLKKPISSKSLGKLLNHIQGGSRIFDGVERDLCAGIYGELIKKLRENSKIAKTNFAVKDDLTGRTYVLDDDGKFGYLSHKDSLDDKAKIKKKNWMSYATKGVTTGGLITGGFLTGGVSAVLNPLSWKGLATIPLFAGGALSAANLGAYGTRNRRKSEGFDYGVVDQNPPGLVMCTDSQTKELLKNPLLMGRMIKAMNDRLGNIHFK